MRDRSIRSQMTRIEVIHLTQLLGELCDLLTTHRDGADPAQARLTPAAYRDDDDASHAFSEATRDDLLDRRVQDARTVISALGDVATAETRTDAVDDPHESVVVIIPEMDVDAWMRALAALRLVLADRLGVQDQDRAVDDDRFGLYDWLGYRLELIVIAADALP